MVVEDNVSDTVSPDAQKVFWHRELPPLSAEPIGEHTVESTSDRVQGILGHRDELWNRCYEDLMFHTTHRLEQEIARLGGDYAHVVQETIDSRHDDAKGEGWLHGTFDYVLYRRSARSG
jgi:hypothetical protein